MKITVFELLKLVKENKAPKEIKYDTMNYVFRNYDYKEIHGELIDEQSSWLEKIDFYKFDEPVEILEEEKKIPEKISLEIDKFEDSYYDTALIKVASKIDELIDYLDYLKSKGE